MTAAVAAGRTRPALSLEMKASAEVGRVTAGCCMPMQVGLWHKAFRSLCADQVWACIILAPPTRKVAVAHVAGANVM